MIDFYGLRIHSQTEKAFKYLTKRGYDYYMDYICGIVYYTFCSDNDMIRDIVRKKFKYAMIYFQNSKDFNEEKAKREEA